MVIAGGQEEVRKRERGLQYGMLCVCVFRER